MLSAPLTQFRSRMQRTLSFGTNIHEVPAKCSLCALRDTSANYIANRQARDVFYAFRNSLPLIGRFVNTFLSELDKQCEPADVRCDHDPRREYGVPLVQRIVVVEIPKSPRHEDEDCRNEDSCVSFVLPDLTDVHPRQECTREFERRVDDVAMNEDLISPLPVYQSPPSFTTRNV